MVNVLREHRVIQWIWAILLLGCWQRADGQSLAFDQVNVIAKAGLNEGFGFGVATAGDAQGNVYVTGHFGGRQQFGSATLQAPGFDMYVAKLDSAGRVLWAVQGGGPSDDYSHGIALDAQGNAYIIGEYVGATATYGATTLRNNRTGSYFVAKISAGGQWLWATGGADGDNIQFNSIAVGADGVIWLAGNVGGARRPDANLGAFSVTSRGATDVIVGRLSAAGTWLGVVTAGGLYADGANGIALDAAGNAYVTGSFSSPGATFGSRVLNHSPYGQLINADIFAAKLDATGTWQWATGGGGNGTDVAYGIAVDKRGRGYLTGSFEQEAFWGNTRLVSAGDKDVFTAGLAPDGTWQWAGGGGGTGYDVGQSLAVSATGDVYVGGSFRAVFGAAIQTAQFGPTVLSSAGTDDAFVLRLDSAGNYRGAVAGGGVLEDACTSVMAIGRKIYLSGFVSSSINASPSARFGIHTITGNPTTYGRMYTGWTARMTAPTNSGTTLPGGGSGGTGTGSNPDDPFDGWDAQTNIPNVITPNRDGHNDYFAPRNLPSGPWLLTVYSRWGVQVYQSADYHNDWGATAATGVYYYVLRHLVTGRMYKAWVEVMR